MKIIKKFRKEPAGVFDLCWKCHSLIHVEIRDLKMASNPSALHLHAVPILYNFHYRCPVCKTLVDLGSHKTDSIPYQIHDKKIEGARERYEKLSPKQREKQHIF